MSLDKFDQDELDEIAANVGLERESQETWPMFAMRVLKAYDQPILKTRYGTTISRLVKLSSKIMQK